MAFFSSGAFDHEAFKALLGALVRNNGIAGLLSFLNAVAPVCSNPVGRAYMRGIERALHNDFDTALTFFYESIALEPSRHVHVAIMGVLDKKIAIDPAFEIDLEGIFTNVYKAKVWGDHPETASGSGSTLENTENLRPLLVDVIRQLAVGSLLDVPCGDFAWINAVLIHPDLARLTYIGGDIVGPMIEENRKRYNRDGVSFIQLDLTSSPLPSTDLVLCRELFIHLTNHQIKKALLNLSRASARYFLMSSCFVNITNVDNATGGVRIVNLMLPPFNLPHPLGVIWEEAPAHTTFTSTRYGLGLWKREDLDAFAKTQEGAQAAAGRETGAA